jgi:hypothetical protein
VGKSLEDSAWLSIIVYSEYTEGLGRTPGFPGPMDVKIW